MEHVDSSFAMARSAFPVGPALEDARLARRVLEDSQLQAVASEALASNPDEVRRLLDSVADTGCDREYRCEVLHALSASERVSYVAHHLGALENCFTLLSGRPEPKECNAVRHLLSAACGKHDEGKRASKIAELIQSLCSPSADTAVAILSSLVGRHTLLTGESEYHSQLISDAVVRDCELLGHVARALEATASQEESLCCVVCALASAFSRHEEDRRLIDSGMVNVLVRKLPHPRSAEALFLIAKTQVGQEAVAVAAACGPLQSCLSADDGEARTFSARALGRIAAFPRVRDAVFSQLSESVGTSGSMRCLGEAIVQSQAAARAAVRQGAMDLLVTLLRDPLDPSSCEDVLLCVRGIATNGDITDRVELVRCGGMGVVVGLLCSHPAAAWNCVAALIRSSEEARAEALALNVPRQLEASMHMGGVVAYYACSAISTLCDSECGAEAVAASVSPSALRKLLIVSDPDEDAERRLANFASIVIGKLVRAQPALGMPSCRKAIAEEMFQPALALLKLPPHPTAGKADTTLVDELATSELGRKQAAALVEAVVNGSEGVWKQAAPLAGRVVRRCFEILDVREETLVRKLTRALPLSRCAEDQAAVFMLLAEELPTTEQPSLIKAGGVKWLLQSIAADEVALAELSMLVLLQLTRGAAPRAAMLEEGGIDLLLHAARSSQPGALSKAFQLLSSLLADGGTEEELSSAMIDGGVLDLINSALDADPDCDLEATKAACVLLGNLACVDEGEDAALLACLDRSVHVVAEVMTCETGRSLAADPEVFDRLAGWLCDASAQPVDVHAALTALERLTDGNAESKESAVPLLPHVLPYLTHARSTPRCLSAIAEMLSSIAAGGTDAIAALLEHGVFPLLVPLMRRAVTSEPLRTLDSVRDLLAISLDDKKTTSVTSALLDQMLAVLPAQVDPFDAHEVRVAMHMLDFDQKDASVNAYLREAGAIELLARVAFESGEWGTLRAAVGRSANLLCLLAESADGVVACRKLGMLESVLDQLERCRGEEAEPFVDLLGCFTGTRDPLLRADLAASRFLETLTLWANPCLSFYGATVHAVQIFTGFCSPQELKRCDQVVSKILGILERGRVKFDENATHRSLFMLSDVATLPAGRMAVKRLIKNLSAELNVAHEAAQHLVSVIQSLNDGAVVAAEEGAAAALIMLLEDREKAKIRKDVLQCLFSLARLFPDKVEPAARTCSHLVNRAIEEKDVSRFEDELEDELEDDLEDDVVSCGAPRVLAAIAGVSAKARATIAATVHRIFEEEDEAHELTVLRALSDMCCRQPGATAAFAAGIVPQLDKALARACAAMAAGRKTRAAALKALTTVAQQSESARAAMQDGEIIPLTAQLLASGISDTREQAVADRALALLLALSEAESLRLAIQAVHPLDAIEHVCRSSVNDQRMHALMLLSNVYAEAIYVGAAQDQDTEVGARNRRVRGLLETCSFAHLAVERLASSSLDFEFAEEPIETLRSYLVAIRSLALDEKLAAELVEAAVTPHLVRALRTMGNVRDCATSGDLAIVAEVIQKLGYRAALRPALVDAGARAALEETRERAHGAVSPTEGDLRLLQASTAALDALDGKLDVPNTSEMVGTLFGSLSDDALAKMPQFHVFLSHRRLDAQDFARSLYALLVGKGFDCFLDVEALEEISDLPLLVASCDAIIFILTDRVLESRWCLKELAAALAAGVAVILITKEGARWPDEEGNMTCTFPPPHLIAQLEPPLVRKAFMTKAISHSNEYYASFTQQLVKRVQAAVASNAQNAAERAKERRKRLKESQESGNLGEPEYAAAGVSGHWEPKSPQSLPSRSRTTSQGPPQSVNSPTVQLPGLAEIRNTSDGASFHAVHVLADIASRQMDAITKQSQAMEKQAQALEQQSRAFSEGTQARALMKNDSELVKLRAEVAELQGRAAAPSSQACVLV